MRISRETMLMQIAHIAASRGTCRRLAVGAVIAVESRVVSIGYAGVPSHELHCEQNDCDLTKPCTRTIHAEVNAISFAKEHNINIIGADMYATDSPCVLCAHRVVDAGIKRLFYDRPYRITHGVDILKHNGIEVWQVLSNGYVNLV